MRIVRLANYVAPASGGLRTALRELGAGYQAAGHEPVLVIPGPRPGRSRTEQGMVVTGAWARARGVRSMMESHDSLDGLMAMFSPPGMPAARLADHFNRATAASYDVVVCTTAWAAAEFRRLGVPNLLQVSFGVDLACFHRDRRDEALHSRLAPGGQALLVHCSRLSPEKRPQRAVGALAELRRRGVPAVLVVAGDGPQRRAPQAQARGLPVRFLRHVSDRGLLARLLATADLVIAPGPVETFGFSALEALASGTPVVVSSRSALPEIVGPAAAAGAGRMVARMAGSRSWDRPRPARRSGRRQGTWLS